MPTRGAAQFSQERRGPSRHPPTLSTRKPAAGVVHSAFVNGQEAAAVLDDDAVLLPVEDPADDDASPDAALEPEELDELPPSADPEEAFSEPEPLDDAPLPSEEPVPAVLDEPLEARLSFR